MAWIDAEIDRLLRGLEALGQLERTIIVFVSDHGRHLGERGALAKHTFAPPSQRIPLIVVHPDLRPGRRTDLVDQVDLARTFCALAGVAPPSPAGGRDLFGPGPEGPLLSTIGFGYVGSFALPNLGLGTWSDGTGWPRRSCVRTGRWRYDRTVRRNGRDVALTHPDADVFLADTDADPAEIVNVASRPEHAELIADLDGLLSHLRQHAVELPEDVVYPNALPGARAV